MTVRVVIADDQTVVREGLRAMLSLMPGIAVVGTAETAEQAMDLVAGLDPDVLLTDLRMPGIGGVEGIRRLRNSGTRPAAVALTTFDDDDVIRQAMGAGALGFLGKDADPDTIAAAIRTAAAGDSLLNATALRVLAGHDPQERSAMSTPRVNPDGLTDREIEVLLLIAGGSSNTQIARSLVVAMSTVKTHVNHLMAKTGATSRAALVSYAYRHDLVK